MSRDVQSGSVQQLIRQQQVLSHLGHYKGRIDGIWGPKTMAAKKAFEYSGSFAPGFPNGGMPFAVKGPLPKGLSMQGEFLTCGGFDEKQWPPYQGERPARRPAVPNAPSGSLRNRPDRGDNHGQSTQIEQAPVPAAVTSYESPPAPAPSEQEPTLNPELREIEQLLDPEAEEVPPPEDPPVDGSVKSWGNSGKRNK